MTQNVKKDGKNESNRSYEHMQTRGTSGKVCLKKKKKRNIAMNYKGNKFAEP